MKRLLLSLLAVSAAWAQVATEANRVYESAEGRHRMIETLASPERPTELQAEKIVADLKLAPGSTVVDLGTGAGMLLPFLSRAVGTDGKVIAQDIYGDFLDAAREAAGRKDLANVEFLLGDERNPRLPEAAADLVIAVDAYHHFSYPAEMLAGIRRALRPGGRLVIVDYYQNGFHDPDHIRLDKLDVVREIASNGFRLLSNNEHVPGVQYNLEFRSDR